MDLERLVGVAPPVDEDAVTAVLQQRLDGMPVAMPARWVDTPGKADWCAQRLAEVEALARRYRDEVALWTDAVRRVQSVGDWFRDELASWGIAQRTRAVKTVPLAHGTIATRENPARIRVVDEDAAVAWAEVMDADAVKVEKSVLVSKLTRATLQHVLLGLDVTDTETGDTHLEAIPADAQLPVKSRTVQAYLDRWAAMNPTWRCEPIIELRVVDPDGRPVPGLAVVPAEVRATVRILDL